MKNYSPLRENPKKINFKKGDTLVLFGELFNRGYANGLVEEAEKNGVTVIRSTVGRRTPEGTLRNLNIEEAANIPKPFINVPLEAGFDLEKDQNEKSMVEYLKDVKLSDWQNAKIPAQSLLEAKNKGLNRFSENTRDFLKELTPHLNLDGHVHFAHLMAGGVPRCKIVMPLMNRVFKGTGDRFLESKTFWDSGIGELLKHNFEFVTADTFDILLSESSGLRNQIQAAGGTVSYVAYGYHGTEIIINNEFQWQSYAPYIQGWAKIKLEDYSKKWFSQSVNCCVYNCPEILTNSSSIFQGIEIPLYNLMRALNKIAPNHPLTLRTIEECKATLKDDVPLNAIFDFVDQFLNSEVFKKTSVYEGWPQHSTKETLALGLETSDKIMALHKDEKVLLTGTLSELIFKACGYIMLHEGYKPRSPVAWIGHDIVVKNLTQ